MRDTRENPILHSIFVAIICTLVIVGLSLLPAFNFLIFLCSIPIVVLAERKGQFFAVLSLAIIGILIGFIDIYVSLLIVITYASMLIAVPYVIRKRLELADSLAICSGAALVAMVISLKILSLMVGQDIFTYTWDFMRELTAQDNEVISNILELYKSIGILDNAITSIQFGELLIDRFKLLTPSMLIISSIIYGGSNFLLSRRILKLYNIYVQDIPEFSRWKLPRGTTRGFIIILILSSLGLRIGLKNFDVVVATVSMLFTFIFSIQGLAILVFILKRTKIPKPLRYIINIFSFLLLKSPLSIVGVFDQIFNIRGIENGPKNNA